MSSAAERLRWWAVAVFGLYTALNYLDRQILAALAPQIKAEFALSNEDYGWMQSAFSIAYALCAPFAGLLIDRLGLRWGPVVCIGVWSLAGTATGLTAGFGGLLVCRILLGAAEGGGIPGFGKAAATYLRPEERALGTGFNQLGISFGVVLAPLLAGLVATAYGWRAAFAVGGALGFLWIPLWLSIERKAGPGAPAGSSTARSATPLEMLRDPRLWSMMVGNILVMTGYSLWTNWTTIFLVQRFQLTQTQVNESYAWIPPVFAGAGGLFGGWMALRMMRTGVPLMQARSRSILIGCLACLLATGAVPYMPSPATATALVGLSFFWTVAVSSNLYALPQDVFGARRTAFGVSAITFGYGIMQTFYAPLVGRLVDRYSFEPVCALTAVLPMLGWLALRVSFRDQPGEAQKQG